MTHPPTSIWLAASAASIAALLLGVTVLSAVLIRRHPVADAGGGVPVHRVPRRAAGPSWKLSRNPVGRLSRRPGLLVMAAALLLLGSAALTTGRAAHDLPRAGPIGAAIESRTAVTAELAVTDEPRALAASGDRGRQQGLTLVRGNITAATARGVRFSAATPVLVLGDRRWGTVRPGQRVSVAGALTPTEPGAREAAFLRASAPPRMLDAPGPIDAGIARIRAMLREQSAAQSSDAGQLVPGLVLGDRAPLGEDLRSAMAVASLTHLTAVSGTNCTIVLACVLGLGVVLRAPRWSLVPAAGAALTGFVVVVGPDPSVLRAAVMGAVGAVAVVSGRGRVPVAMLCTAVGVLLLIDPYLATSLGFALSVVATGALIGLCGPVEAALTVVLAALRLPRVPGGVVRAVAVPLAAQMACAPLLVLVQPAVSTWGVAANAVVAPLVPVVTVAGSIAVLLGALWAPLSLLPLWLAARCADAIALAARAVAAAPAAMVPWPDGLPGAALLAVADAGIVGALLLLGRRRRGPRPSIQGRSAHGRESMPSWAAGVARRGHGWPPLRDDAGAARSVPGERRRRQHLSMRRALVRAGIVVAGVAVVAAGTAAFTVAVPVPPPGQWQLAMCDVGQGDGLVLRADRETAMLVDSGPPGPAMARCLDRLGVRRLAAVLLTHQHDDHYGGLDDALRGRTVDRYLVSAADATLAPAVATLIRRVPAPVEHLVAPAHGTIGAITWSVLWPRTPRPIGDENDNSVVLRVDIATSGGSPLRVLLTGDLEEDGTAALLRARGTTDELRGVDVIKVAHHGARNGGTAILDAVRASVALVSVGRDNDYGHPASGILDHLRGLGTVVWRTDQQGAVTVRRTGDHLVLTALPP
ncbi:ComEC/Rec2 family competence protein [Tersicoccus sp. Bi-70]|uniref:ComEC/Rec2 family competence protein n=1 Tax=Tersicoccus sp. Bi-70 TaxID=1897634 RepID=UPI0013013500|nr:ComEC/Rec2 family competence protein [Tersicoccus sp. Bi-70]